jgi:general nucleoside transport system ATP-binding protein
MVYAPTPGRDGRAKRTKRVIQQIKDDGEGSIAFPIFSNAMNIELNGITKTFGSVVANDDIRLTIPAGTIQGILGENGAGKSTLMKILSGFFLADRGEIRLDGKAVTIQSPADAIQYGVGMLHQDPLDFPPLKVIDDFLLGRKGSIFPKRAQVIRDFNELQEQYNFSLDPGAFVETLTVGERQQLEILRLLWLGARVLILDEPTTGISALQKEKLFASLRVLAGEGKTIILVSHKLEDVEFLCGRVAVLRRGKLVGEAAPPYETEQLVKMMFGKAVTMGDRQPCSSGDTLLTLQGLAVEDFRMQVRAPDLEIRAGEVIGLAGMEGSGERLFLKACCGLLRPVAGKVLIQDQDLTGKNYLTFLKHGVAFMPASRMEEGLVAGLTLKEHFVLAEEQASFFVDWEKSEQDTNEKITEYNIRGKPDLNVESLSGGNQQRALLALMKTPLNLVLMEHPTRGLDVESAIYIWSKMKERCRQGSAIIFISSDLDELLQYSDRLLVFFAGKVSSPLDAETTSVDRLGELIGGKGWLFE